MTAEDEKERMTLQDILSRANGFLQRKLHSDVNLGTVLTAFVTEEEFTLETIVEDLADSESDLVECLATELQLKSDTDLQFLLKVLRILFGLEADAGTPINDLKWDISSKATEEARVYIETQCPDAIKEEQDEAMLQIIAIGKQNNDVPLLTLVYDVYSKYRLQLSMTKRDATWAFLGEKIKCEDFASMIRPKVIALRNNDSLFTAFKTSLRMFEKRLNPGFKLHRHQVMDDSCDDFIAYTLMVAQVLQKHIDVNMPCLPLQVDLVIIPRKSAKFEANAFDADDDENDDDVDTEEEEEEEDDDYKEQGAGAGAGAGVVHASVLQSMLEQLFFDETDCTLSQRPIDCTHPNFDAAAEQPLFDETENYRTLLNHVSKHSQGKNHRRVSIVIDRRRDPRLQKTKAKAKSNTNTTDADTTPDRIYVYSVPNHDTIPKDYCIENLICNAAQFVMPKENVNAKIGMNADSAFVGGKYDNNGYNFQISFQMMQMDRIRLHWFYAGGGMRFWPELMVTLWPSVFKGHHINPQYTQEFVKQRFALPVEDTLFNAWYDTLTTS